MRRIASALAFALAAVPLCALAQQDSGDVHVSVVLNADGSRTVYENDAANHKTVATTTGKDGKMREKIRYELDENGRFARAEVLGPKEQFRFFAQYKYDASNHVIEETHFAKDQSVIGRIVFRYDAAGHQIGYSTYDGAGKLLGQTVAPTASPAKHKKAACLIQRQWQGFMLMLLLMRVLGPINSILLMQRSRIVGKSFLRSWV